MPDYDYLITDVKNTLENDSIRSGGKKKLNCDRLYYLYSLREIYSKVLEEKNSKKSTTKKKEVN